MKNHYKLMTLILAGILALLPGYPAQAQSRAPGTVWMPAFPGLRVITTEHFEIIYPPASEQTARTLAGFADRVYGELALLLGGGLTRRLPVSITPSTEAFNGYVNPWPYFHMVLLDAPMPIDAVGAFANNLEGLFTHELTHALTLSIKGPGWKGLHSVFGGWVYPMILTAPGFISEGTAVAVESRDGITGRANDPLIRQGLIQAIHENKFLDPVKALGTYDLDHLANPAYHYGGCFSVWLRDKYGPEKLAELWAAMGSRWRISLDPYAHGFFAVFTQVYQRPFPEAWNEWKETLRISGIEENPQQPVFTGEGCRIAQIGAVSSGGGRVFVLDRNAGKVYVYDPAGGKARKLFDADRNGAYNLTASADGTRLFLSSWRTAGSLNNSMNETRTVVTEYDAKSGWKTGRVWWGLYDGRPFRGGAVGLGADKHNNRIVYRPPETPGAEEVLLQGTEELLYSDPVPLDDRRIAFIAAFKGERRLCLYDYDTREVFTVASALEDDPERWRYIRGLGVSEGKLFFSYNDDYRMYKLGVVDTAVLEAVFSRRNLSGGVFRPALAAGEVYYRGAFASEDALMKFPETAEALSGLRAPVELKPWDEEQRRLAALPAASAPSALPSDTALMGAAGTGEAAPASARYWGLKYLNPFRFWLPYPLMRFDPKSSIGVTLNGPGFLTMMADPQGLNQITFTAAMDVPYLMGAFKLDWANYSLGLPLGLTISDDLDTARTLDDLVLRKTDFSLRAVFSRGLGSERLYFTAAPQFTVSLRSKEPRDGTFASWESAYTWAYNSPLYLGGLTLGLNNGLLTKPAGELFGQGFSLESTGQYDFTQGIPPADQALPRIEGVFQAAFEPWLPLRFRLYGAWDERGMNLGGQSKTFSTAAFDEFSSKEYVETSKALRTTDLRWLGGGEAEVKLFSAEVQSYFSHLYLNRFFGTLAYRGLFYDGGEDPAGDRAAGTPLGGNYRLAQSLALRLGGALSTGIAPPLAAYHVKLALVTVWKISALNNGKNDDFWFGPEFSLSF